MKLPALFAVRLALAPALGYVVDPWGTAIEMTEYLAPDTH
jgi:hypothetical protein